ncbi:magnesium transporter [Pycnococcus provasolii]
MQIHAINVSLGHNDALYHIPSFFVLWNLLSIMSSAVVYEEIKLGSRDGESFYFFGMSLTSPDPLASAWALFVLGVGSLFLGVYLVASRSRTRTGSTASNSNTTTLTVYNCKSTYVMDD